MAAYFDIRGTATKILTASIATLTITTLLVVAYGVKIAGNLIPSTNDAYTVGTSTGPFLWKEGWFSDVLNVGGQDVCLEDGTNCPAAGAGGSDSNWVYNASNSFLRLVTSTNDVLIGGTTTNTAAFVLDVNGLNTRLTTSNITATGTLDVTGVSTFGTATGTQANFNAATLGVLTYGTATGSTLTGTLLNFSTATGSNVNALSATFATATVSGIGVCLSNGVNCPSAGAEADTLATVTGRGSLTNTTLQLYGGFIASSSTVTSTFRVLGVTTLASTTVEGKGICLNDGTYCPPATAEADTLQSVTARGAVTNQALSLYAGFTAASSSVTSTFNVWGTMNALAIVSPTATIMGKGVCLSDGTYCAASVGGGGGSDINWTWSEAGGFVRQTTTTNDLILGSAATTTGAPIYLDTSGATIGTSTLTIGHSTNVNVVIGGTSSTQVAAGSSLFVMNGDDLWVKGNIGSATTVYAVGGFRTGGAVHNGAGILGVSGNMELSFSGALQVKNINDLTRILVIDPLLGNIYPFGVTDATLGTVSSPFSRIYTSSTWTTSGNLVPGANNEMMIGSATRSIATIHASGTSQLAYVSSTAISVGTQAVCLEDGTDCPAGSSPQTLAQVSALGASATATLQLWGGFLASSSTVTSSFYVVGDTTLTNATATTLFTTSLRGTSSTITTMAATSLFADQVTSTALFATSFKATSSTIATLAAGTFFFGNATGTSLFTSGTASSSLLFANMATLGGLVVSSTTVCLTSGVGCPVASDSVVGIVELATIGETSAGSDATRAVTPDGLAGSVFGSRTVELYLTTSSGALLAVNSASNTSTCFTVQPPLAGMVLTAAHVAHGVAGSGTTSTVVNIQTTSSAFLLSTPLYIDPGEYGSDTAVTSSVINTSNDDVYAYERLCALVQNVENTTPGKETIMSMTFTLP